MAKLSRKEKYQDLRDSLEQESEPQVSTKQARSTRMAAPDFKADQKLRGPVIEDLLGEVKQYNLDNGELVTDDTQMQILHDLSSQEQAAARRSVHFETMEQNEDVGGTTRNLYGSDLSSLMSNPTTRRPSQPIQSNPTQVNPTTASQTRKVQNEEPDFLDLFTPGQQTNEEPMVEIVEEEKTKEKPILFGNTRRKRRKTTRQTNAQPAEDLEKTLDSQSLDALFVTTEVPVNDSYFSNQDDGPEVPFTNRNQQAPYQESVYDEEDEDYEEDQPSGRFASLINKVRRKTRPNVEEYEDEAVEEEEPPVVVSKKVKKASPSTSTAQSSQTLKQQTKQVKAKQASKASKESSSNNEQVSTSAVIFMVACCVILLLLILLTIFWMSKLGIF